METAGRFKSYSNLQCCGPGTEPQKPQLFALAETECIPDPVPETNSDTDQTDKKNTKVKIVLKAKRRGQLLGKQCCH